MRSCSCVHRGVCGGRWHVSRCPPRSASASAARKRRPRCELGAPTLKSHPAASIAVRSCAKAPCEQLSTRAACESDTLPQATRWTSV
eukprot:1625202-Pleurochrysis_carterae.AAC.5